MSDDWLEGGAPGVDPAALTSREACRVFGISPRDLDRWIREGAPHGRTGGVRSPLVLNSAELFKWYAERLESDESILESKRRERHAIATMKEVRTAELLKQTIRRSDAIAMYSEHVGEFRKRLFEIPDQVSELTEAQRRELDGAINVALAEFSGLPAEGDDTKLEGGDDWEDVGGGVTEYEEPSEEEP